MEEIIRLYAEKILESSNLLKLLVNKNKGKSNLSDVVRDAEAEIEKIKKDIVESTCEWFLNELRSGKFSKEIEEEIDCRFELETLKRGIIQNF